MVGVLQIWRVKSNISSLGMTGFSVNCILISYFDLNMTTASNKLRLFHITYSTANYFNLTASTHWLNE